MNPFSKAVLRFAPLLVAAAAAGCVSPSGDTPEAQRADIRAMRDETLSQAYARWPELKSEIAKAPGYAVMNNGLIKILLLGTVKGYGVAVDNAGKETFVNDFAIAFGPAIEVGSARGVIVFHDPVALQAFIDGSGHWGLEADAIFKFGDFGGQAIWNSQGGPVEVHRVFQNGVGLGVMAYWLHSGTDDDYNGTPAATN
jgi:lipid-binding SYLF domain-containing protein